MDLAIIGGGPAAVSLLDALAATQSGPPRECGTHACEPGTDICELGTHACEPGTHADTGTHYTPGTHPIPTSTPGHAPRPRGGPRTITVFEPSPSLWRGRPYGPDLDAVRVNAPPAIMSVRHGDFGHYAAWLGESGGRGGDHMDELLGAPLVPRALYGDYLVETAEKATAALGEQGWRVRVVSAPVSEVARSGTHGSGLVLRTHDMEEYEATHVALCVGQGAPPDPYGLGGNPRFVPDPYPLADTVARLPRVADVAIIGSGLTAVDVVAGLAARGHQGHLTLFSRSGVLPHVWQRPDGRRPQHFTVERVAALHAARGRVTLDDLGALFGAELADAGEDAAELAADLLDTEAQDPFQWLGRQIAAIDSPRVGRRVLQESAHTVGPYVWRLLPESDRARVRRHLRTAISVASPMVPVNAAVLMRLMGSGRLTITPGIQVVEQVNGHFRIRHDGGEALTEFVVNAVNPAPHTVPAAARDLVRSLVDTGLATLHEQGGLAPADPRVRVVGDLAADGSFITSSIPGIAAQASRAARALLET